MRRKASAGIGAPIPSQMRRTVFSGSFIVEVVTSWPGLGRLMFDALKARDLFLVAGCAATGAFFLAAGTLFADLLLAWTDPRVASGERT